jgi:hypothetical protein
MGAETVRLLEARTGKVPWKKWGPYLSERQWGTVREDYSEDENAWDYFTHDQTLISRPSLMARMDSRLRATGSRPSVCLTKNTEPHRRDHRMAPQIEMRIGTH